MVLGFRSQTRECAYGGKDSDAKKKGKSYEERMCSAAPHTRGPGEQCFTLPVI